MFFRNFAGTGLNCDINMAENDITFEVFRTIEPLKDIWESMDVAAANQIAAGMPPLYYSFYQTYTWNSFAARFHAAHRSLFKHIEFILMRKNGLPVAIVPLTVKEFPKKKVEFISWKTSGTNNAASLVNIPGCSEQIFNHLADYISIRYKAYAKRFYDLPKQTPFYDALCMRFPQAKCSSRESFHIPINRFAGYEDYFSSLSKRMRQNIRTAANHVADDGVATELKIFDSSCPPSKKYWLNLWKLLYIRKLDWKNKKHNLLSGILCQFKAYLQVRSGMTAASFKALSQSKLIVLEINGEPAAFTLVYRYDNRIIVPKLASNMKFSKYSPGILLLCDTIKWCFENGITDYDLSRGSEPYKHRMGAIAEPICRFLAR